MSLINCLPPQSSLDGREAAAFAKASIPTLPGGGNGERAPTPAAAALVDPFALAPLPLTPARTESTGKLAALVASTLAESTARAQAVGPNPAMAAVPHPVSASFDGGVDNLFDDTIPTTEILPSQVQAPTAQARAPISEVLAPSPHHTSPPSPPPVSSPLAGAYGAPFSSSAAPSTSQQPGTTHATLPVSPPPFDTSAAPPTATYTSVLPGLPGGPAAGMLGPVIVGTPAGIAQPPPAPAVPQGLGLFGPYVPPAPLQLSQPPFQLRDLQLQSMHGLASPPPLGSGATDLLNLLGTAAVAGLAPPAVGVPIAPQGGATGGGDYDLEAELAAIIEGKAGAHASSPPRPEEGGGAAAAVGGAADVEEGGDTGSDGEGAAAAVEAAAQAAAAAAAAAARRPRPAARNQHPGSSAYRGVTRHKRTGRFEAHMWDAGKQIYLGGFDEEANAARAYDLMSLHCRGQADAQLNFPLSTYAGVAAAVAATSRDDMVALLRRHSRGFSRGSSKFRGVTRHKGGRWEARMGQFLGKKYKYLGLFRTENEAAVAYDRSAVLEFGPNAVTNYAMAAYEAEMAAWRASHPDVQAQTRTLWRNPKKRSSKQGAPGGVPAAAKTKTPPDKKPKKGDD